MSKQLVIVESPTKARTLSRFLGADYKIEASMGHVRDLPKAKLGVDVERDFDPQYVIPKDKRKIVEHLKDVAGDAKEIILATDPDREGEAIAWHVAHIVGGIQNAELRSKKEKNKKKKNSASSTINSKFSRIVFHEITKEAILEALKSPRSLDLKLVDAQVARRVLDRLVGYKLSPLLWVKVKKGLSAGRVQSVAVRLIVEREREIEAFKPQEYWSIEALLRKQKAKSSEQFEASLVKIDGKKAEVKNEKQAKEIVTDLENKDTVWQVADVEQKEVKRYPYPPFTTSTMTQGAANLLGFTAKKTMKLAQDLYEEGLITYHRTDSFNLAPIALGAARKYIKENFGSEYLPPTARIYKTKSKVAQEAHEAIRPTDVRKQQTANSEQLSKDHQRLYDLIWKRFVACQMAESIYDQVTLDIQAARYLPSRQVGKIQDTNYLFRAVGSVIKFSGWQKVYDRDAGQTVEPDEKPVPALAVGAKLDLLKLTPDQHFTEPPPRYTEASLIKILEEKGIGRPSTYAPIISTILERRYVELEERKFRPTPLGAATNDFLVKNFPQEIDVGFTAKMEDQLDDIANGERKWVPIIREFYNPFEKHLSGVFEKSERVKIFPELTDEKCPEGHPLVIRYGPFGKFLACEKYPEHKYTKQFESEEFRIKNEELKKLNLKCPKSGDPVILRQTRRGRIFYGCSGYPKCKWASWQLPKDG
ncbi:MAG: DNA topoisomerase I [Candidatus Woykebacteria bacterium GWB1_45_5]|uniref:DNA topoisomerase 1 n=2 Tax=Candidatus Woykeibacteriota TaxID=1817899 RepID=A0A1G1W479_9BACT|nr:MAG: DNA topoisomerase I [Candidatus Woykebacteria bacterium GWA1_44_8]OGY24361.1 MAG: DNA topoisomerase I [Candidatus Woykebacteria bacterium GWB1_45_5]